MATTSGKGGTVRWNSSSGQSGTELAAVLGWTLDRNVTTHAFHGSTSTGAEGTGFKERVAGTADWSASVRCKYDAATKIVPTIGQEVEVTLWVDDNEATSGQYDRYYANCVAEKVELEVDVDTGKAVAFVLSISGDGVIAFAQSVPP